MANSSHPDAEVTSKRARERQVPGTVVDQIPDGGDEVSALAPTEKHEEPGNPKANQPHSPWHVDPVVFRLKGPKAGKPRFKLFTVGKSTPKQMKKGSNRVKPD